MEKVKRLTTEQFINKSISIHGDRYDYSMVKYINSKTKVEIICKEHGVFLQLPTDHCGKLKCGCPNCGHYLNNRNIGLDGFIKKATAIHGNKYNYSNSIYVNYDAKIDIGCSKHGVFAQFVSNHLAGNGCPKCSYESKNGSYAHHNRAIWENTDGYFYNIILEHKDTKETFNKVGITVNPKIRFNHYKPYEMVNVIELSEMKLGTAFDREQEMIKNMNKYRPLEKFCGHTECYRN